MLDFQKDRLRHLVANAILELWKKETGSTTSVYIEGTLCITAKNGKTTIVQVADQFPGSIPDEGESEVEEKGINGITPLRDSSPTKKEQNTDSFNESPSSGRHFLTSSKRRDFSQGSSPENRLPGDFSRRFDGTPLRGSRYSDGVRPKGRRHLLEVNTGNTGRYELGSSDGKRVSDDCLNFSGWTPSSAKKNLDKLEDFKSPKHSSTYPEHFRQNQEREVHQFVRPPQQNLDSNNNYRTTETNSSPHNRRGSRNSAYFETTNILENTNRFSREGEMLDNTVNDNSEDSYDDDDDDDNETDGNHPKSAQSGQNDSGIADTNCSLHSSNFSSSNVDSSNVNGSNFDSSLMNDSCKRTPAKRHLESGTENQRDGAQPLSSVDSGQRKMEGLLTSPNSYSEQMRDSIKRRLLSTLNSSLMPLGLSPFGFPFPSPGSSTSSPFPSAADIFQNSLPSYAHLASTPGMNGWPMPMGIPHPNHGTPGGLLHMATQFSPPHFNHTGRGEHSGMMSSPQMRQSMLSPSNSLHQILSSSCRAGMSSSRRRQASIAHRSERDGSLDDQREGKEMDGNPDNVLENPGGEQRVYRCDQCFKTFLFKSKYLEHLPVHTSARPFQCHLCSRTYKYKYDLRVHLRAHLGIPTKSTVCPFCIEKFGTNKQLRQHIHEAHKEQQAIGEDQCFKSLQQIAALKAVRSNSQEMSSAGQAFDEVFNPNFSATMSGNEFKSDGDNDGEDDFGHGSTGQRMPEDEGEGRDKRRNSTEFDGEEKVDAVERDDRVMSQQSTSESSVTELLVIDESATTEAE